MRKTWNVQVQKKLKNEELSDEEIFNFKKDLINFMNTEICYNIKRLLPADLKTIFTYSSITLEETENRFQNPFDEDYTMKNNKIGGLNVTDYVIYDCLVPEDWDYAIEDQVLEAPLDCLKCQSLCLQCSVLKIFHHEKFCSVRVKTEVPDVVDVGTKPNSTLFHCDVCNSDLRLRPIDILRHKKSCT